MENTVLEMLGKLQEAARQDQMKQQQHTLEEIKQATQQLAQRQFAQAA